MLRRSVDASRRMIRLRCQMQSCHVQRFMHSSIGIVGLPNVGKSTLFNALTATQAAQAANYPFCTIEPNIARVQVPDPHLDRLAALNKSQKTIYAQIEFVDIAGLVRGASKGLGMGNKFLSNIRKVSVIMHVLRCFDDSDIIHVEDGGIIDPVRDLETIRTELMLSDLQRVERALQQKKTPLSIDGETYTMALKMAQLLLEDSKPIKRDVLSSVCSEDVLENVWRAVSSLELLSSKPSMYICNVDENCVVDGNDYVNAVKSHVSKDGPNESSSVLLVCSRLEEEASNSFETIEAQREYLELAGLNSTGLTRVVAAAYDKLGLHSFYTIGPQQARAWPIAKASTAIHAAGCIHTDFVNGFIRAETISYDDFVQCGSESDARDAGKCRQESRDYIVQSGDVILFRFSVSKRL